MNLKTDQMGTKESPHEEPRLCSDYHQQSGRLFYCRSSQKNFQSDLCKTPSKTNFKSETSLCGHMETSSGETDPFKQNYGVPGAAVASNEMMSHATRGAGRRLCANTADREQSSNKDKGREGLFIHWDRGAQVRTIKGRPDNETQVTKIEE